MLVDQALAVVERPRVVLGVERTFDDELGVEADGCLVRVHAVEVRIRALIVDEHDETFRRIHVFSKTENKTHKRHALKVLK